MAQILSLNIGSHRDTENSRQQRPLLAHIHVPKTGGSSIRSVLDKHFGASHLHLYPNRGTTFVFENGELEQLVGGDEVNAFSSHFVRRFPSRLANRPVQYVAFLRDPVEQFLSYITYTRKYYAAIALKDEELLSHLPPRMPDLTIRECASWMLQGPPEEFLNFRENYCTNFFARYPMLDEHGLSYADPAYRQRRFDTALRVLNEFLLVGICELMDESWAVLQRRAAETGIQLPATQIPVENVTSTERDCLSWIHPDDEVGQKLLLSTAEDRKLYEWSRERLKSMSPNNSANAAPVGSLFQSYGSGAGAKHI